MVVGYADLIVIFDSTFRRAWRRVGQALHNEGFFTVLYHHAKVEGWWQGVLSTDFRPEIVVYRAIFPLAHPFLVQLKPGL